MRAFEFEMKKKFIYERIRVRFDTLLLHRLKRIKGFRSFFVPRQTIRKMLESFVARHSIIEYNFQRWNGNSSLHCSPSNITSLIRSCSPTIRNHLDKKNRYAEPLNTPRDRGRLYLALATGRPVPSRSPLKNSRGSRVTEVPR